MKKTRKKIKYLKPRMIWNSGTMSYEPNVNSNADRSNNKSQKLNWVYIILIILGLILFLILLKIFG
ncbi:hypothetical protein FJZ19_01590 [Candidatus Pacearchaeota archaeon]|nr:hypothetical protein [Candidatus Pacearchaeota archaeon]